MSVEDNAELADVIFNWEDSHPPYTETHTALHCRNRTDSVPLPEPGSSGGRGGGIAYNTIGETFRRKGGMARLVTRWSRRPPLGQVQRRRQRKGWSKEEVTVIEADAAEQPIS